MKPLTLFTSGIALIATLNIGCSSKSPTQDDSNWICLGQVDPGENNPPQHGDVENRPKCIH